MPNKRTEKILEPNKIYVGSNFLLKIKAIRQIKYREIKVKKVKELKPFTVANLKGE